MRKDILKPLHVGWKFSVYEVWKMINVEVDPKEFYFRHDKLVSSMCQFKSYLLEKCFNHLESIKNKFLEDISVRSAESTPCIIAHV